MATEERGRKYKGEGLREQYVQHVVLRVQAADVRVDPHDRQVIVVEACQAMTLGRPIPVYYYKNYY